MPRKYKAEFSSSVKYFHDKIKSHGKDFCFSKKICVNIFYLPSHPPSTASVKPLT